MKVLNLILFFTLYSFMGWVLETLYESSNKKRFINRGFLQGFFCPIYGFGAIIAILINNLINNMFTDKIAVITISVGFSMLIGTYFEFITGFFFEKIFNYRLWDYSDYKANIKGHICLRFSLIWGLIAFIFLVVVHPINYKISKLIPSSVKLSVAIIIIPYFIVDALNSVINDLKYKQNKHENYLINE